MTDKPAENGPVEPAHDEPATLRHEVDYADDAVAQPGHDEEPRPAGVDQDADDDRSTVRPTLQIPADEQITVEVPTERPTEPLDAAAAIEPIEPAEPVEPAEPIEPAEPREFAEPRESAEPAEPALAGPGMAPATEPGFGAPPPPPPPPAPPGGFPPPGPPPGGFPPPAGSFFPPPQPTGGAFAAKYGLIRPLQGRWFAGVAAAIGRATNTDPVLWRVLFAVLTLFGGVGLLVYLIGWLLIPSEGDSASAAEALIGRGNSSTSAPVAIGLGILTVIMLMVAFSGNVRTALLGTAVIIGAALLVSRGTGLGKPANTAPQPPPGAPPQPGQPGAPGAMPPAPPMAAPTAAYSPPTFIPPPTPYTASATATGPYPPGQDPAGPGTTEPSSGYRPPFAPHGPYASSSPYAQSRGYVPYPYPGLVQTSPPPVPKPPKERSRLGRVVLSMACLAIGILVIADVAGASVPGAAYVAAALAVVGFGLVIGAWLGRARWLILPGIVLVIALAAASVPGDVNFGRNFDSGPKGNVTWAPLTVADVTGDYGIDVGNGTLDLSKVDFTDHTVPVNVHVNVGNLVVILPPNVDVDVSAKVDGGSADVLGQHWDGLGNDERQVHDNGADGQGGGKLQLTASVDLGKLEVRR